jgi:hypothetical protein
MRQFIKAGFHTRLLDPRTAHNTTRFKTLLQDRARERPLRSQRLELCAFQASWQGRSRLDASLQSCNPERCGSAAVSSTQILDKTTSDEHWVYHNKERCPRFALLPAHSSVSGCHWQVSSSQVQARAFIITRYPMQTSFLLNLQGMLGPKASALSGVASATPG